jgi:hypothetical protein
MMCGGHGLHHLIKHWRSTCSQPTDDPNRQTDVRAGDIETETFRRLMTMAGWLSTP